MGSDFLGLEKNKHRFEVKMLKCKGVANRKISLVYSLHGDKQIIRDNRVRAYES